MSLTTGVRLSALAALSVLLAACAGSSPPPASGRMSGADLGLASAAASPAAPQARQEVAAVPRVQPGARPGKGAAPRDVLEKSHAAVRRVLGAPDLERKEPPAEVWQYSADTCVLDITFYPGQNGGPALASYLESRTLDGAPMDAARCLGRLSRAGGRD